MRGVCPNFEICMGCFVHVILSGMGCFVSLQKNMWWFLSTLNKMDVGGYVRGVFCPYTALKICIWLGYTPQINFVTIFAT